MPRPIKTKPKDKKIPKAHKPPGSKTPAEREMLIAKTAELDRMGLGQTEIAKRLGVSQPTICNYLQTIKLRYNESTLINRHELVQREFATLMDVRLRAFLGLEEAEKGRKKTRREEGSSEKGGFSKESVEEEGILPPSEYMAVILKTNERICDMFGLDEAVKTIFNVQLNQSNTMTVLNQLMALVAAPDEPPKALPAAETVPPEVAE